jgi:hypothetical protein
VSGRAVQVLELLQVVPVLGLQRVPLMEDPLLLA